MLRAAYEISLKMSGKCSFSRVEFYHAKENSGGAAWYLTKRNFGMAGPFGRKRKRTNNTSESINVPIPKVPLTPLSILKHPVHPMTKMETRKVSNKSVSSKRMLSQMFSSLEFLWIG